MYGLKNGELETIKKTLQASGVREAILFGSRAKGTCRKGSDVDIAVDAHEQKAAYLLNEETSLVYFFDIININKIQNSNLLSHIERVGKKIEIDH